MKSGAWIENYAVEKGENNLISNYIRNNLTFSLQKKMGTTDYFWQDRRNMIPKYFFNAIYQLSHFGSIEEHSVLEWIYIRISMLPQHKSL